MSTDNGVTDNGGIAATEDFDRAAWGLPPKAETPAPNPEPTPEPEPEATEPAPVAETTPAPNEPSAPASTDELSDEDIVASAHGQDGARKVSARLAKYKTERDEATQRAEAAEKELDEQKAIYEQALKAMGFNADAEATAAANMGKAIAEQMGGNADDFATNVDANFQQMQTARAEKAAQAKAIADKLASDLRAIKTAFPDIPEVQNANDIRELGDEYLALASAAVNAGKFDPVKVYEATHIDTIVQSRVRAAQQQAAQAQQSKAHLVPATGKPATAVAIDPSFISEMKRWNPGISDAGIAEAWERRDKSFYA